MPNDPWRRDDAPRPPPHPARVYIWLAFLAALSIGLWALFHVFPEVSLSDMDAAWLVRLVAVLALLGSAVLFGRQFRARDTLRNIAIWLGIAALLTIGYSFRDVLSEVGDRVSGELRPTEPRALDARTVVLTETDGGDYRAVGAVNGIRVRFAIDTGASDIVLSPQDARRAGIDTGALSYDREIYTANGLGHSAETTVASLALGPIRLDDVRVGVNQAAMDSSLLGMAFLRRMRSFEFKDHKLYLRWR
ncbi:MAG TPA: TIGR02281 family clan AA aspartic protease [Rhizomicrobium sp.]